jgi:hypothetical protein
LQIEFEPFRLNSRPKDSGNGCRQEGNFLTNGGKLLRQKAVGGGQKGIV